MTQIAMNFNFERRPSPKELDLEPGSQNYRLYERLLEGEVTNGEMLFQLRIGSHTRRVSDLRERLKPHLMDVEARRIDKGLFSYRLRG